jgi:dihydropteroate synthase
VSEGEELERVIPTIEALVERLGLPVSVDTWRASVLDEACQVGAVVGNDISGFGDPDYLAVAAKHHASVVATHIRLQPRVPDPEPHYDDLLGDVRAFLVERAARAEAAGLAREQISIDAGLDLGKTAAMSAILLRESHELASAGYTLLLSASNKRSSATCSVSMSMTAAMRRSPRSRTASHAGAVSCGFTMSRAACASVARSRRCWTP